MIFFVSLSLSEEDSPHTNNLAMQLNFKSEISLNHLKKLQSETFSAGLSVEEPVSVLLSCDKSKKRLLQRFP